MIFLLRIQIEYKNFFFWGGGAGEGEGAGVSEFFYNTPNGVIHTLQLPSSSTRTENIRYYILLILFIRELCTKYKFCRDHPLCKCLFLWKSLFATLLYAHAHPKKVEGY